MKIFVFLLFFVSLSTSAETFVVKENSFFDGIRKYSDVVKDVFPKCANKELTEELKNCNIPLNFGWTFELSEDSSIRIEMKSISSGFSVKETELSGLLLIYKLNFK